MSNSRQKVLNFIVEQQSTTVEELSKAFHMTPANIRHHLSILMQQGTIKVLGQKSAFAKGRPTNIYIASQYSELSNLDQLSDALLCSLIGNAGSEEKELILKNLAVHLGAEYKNNFLNLTKSLYTAIHSLNRMNYQAHWEAHIISPQIFLGHCPYQSIIERHSELCQMDAALLEHLLGTPVRQLEKQAVNLKGFPECIFQMSKSS
jgi:predicted ArsR family transcriptional regulator